MRAVAIATGFAPSRVARCQVTIFMYLWTLRPPVYRRRAGGRQHVVRARCLVAIGHGRFLAEEERAVAGQPVEPPVEILGLHRQVLGRVIVGGRRHLLAVGADDDLGIVAPGGGALSRFTSGRSSMSSAPAS
jgi:hypothetical protein